MGRCFEGASLDDVGGRVDTSKRNFQNLSTVILKRLNGATVRRVIDRANARVPEHSHEWPVLSLFVFGAYANYAESGSAYIAGPSAIIYRARASHRNDVSGVGFEQIEIEFDPDWLGGWCAQDTPIQRWIGGRVGGDVRSLVSLCSADVSSDQFCLAVRRFLQSARREVSRPPADWVALVNRRVREDAAASVAGLAAEIGLHPSWLGNAYKRACGEGVLETVARVRVEHAARLLRESDMPYAAVASDAGFCDQSHMVRTFRRVLGRLPSIVRHERQHLRRVQ